MAEALQPLTFPPDLYKRLVPSQFLSRHLSSSPSVRPDSRRPIDFRDFSVTTGSLSNTYGSSVVRLGGTIMTCGVRAEIAEPDPFSPRRGYITPNIDIGPLCHASIKAGPPSDLQQSIAYALLQCIQTINVVDLESLCIEEGKAVWALYIDIICLSHTGSLLSTATSAMIAALLSTSLPKARWDIDLASVVCQHEYTPLQVNTVPHVFEFGVFDKIVLADMTDEEELLAKETMTVTMNSEGVILALKKAGGSVLGGDAIDQVLRLAQERLKVVDKTIRSSQKHKL